MIKTILLFALISMGFGLLNGCGAGGANAEDTNLAVGDYALAPKAVKGSQASIDAACAKAGRGKNIQVCATLAGGSCVVQVCP